MRLLALLAAPTALLAAPAAAPAASVDRTEYRYARELVATGEGPVAFEPDGALFEHSAPGLADLRVLDADGEEVPWRPRPVETGERPKRITREPASTTRAKRGSRTLITIDLGAGKIPVDELEIEADADRYDRPVRVLGSNDGRGYVPVGGGRIFRFDGTRSDPLSIGARHRYLRVEIENGDDRSLSGVEVEARSRSHAILVEGGPPRPYTLVYGDPGAKHPSYDFARLPSDAVGAEDAVEGTLGAERPNPAFELPEDRRSFVERYPGLITGTLAIAALVLGAAGLFVLRSRPSG